MSDRHEELKERLLAAVEGRPLPSSNSDMDDELNELLEAIERAPKNFLSPAWVAKEQLPPSNSPPEIEGYEVLEVLGYGGMGVVYRAKQAAPLSREVALKVVRSEIASEAGLERFNYESTALARLKHPNIANVLDTGTCKSGQPYVAMELVEGNPITKFVRDKDLHLDDILELFESVCRGVAHAHACGVIHRDLKPSNILVAVQDGKPVAKIIDFGIAKFIDGDIEKRLTLTNQVFGTLEYVSPEIIADGAGVADVRSDVYSLGSILFELLTSTPPVEIEHERKQSVFRAMQAIHDATIPKPSDRLRSTANDRLRAKDIVGDLDCIVLHSLQRDPSDRFQSAEAFAEDLCRFRAFEPIRANPPGTLRTFSKFVRRNRIVVGATTLVVLTLLGGLLAAVWGYREAERSRIVAVDLQKDNVKAIELLSEAALLANVHEPSAKEHLASLGNRIENVLKETKFDSLHAKFRLQIMLAASYSSRGEMEAARVVLEEAFKSTANESSDPTWPSNGEKFQSLILLAENSINLQKLKEAEGYTRKAIEQATSSSATDREQKIAQAEFVLANSLVAAGKIDDAASIYSRVLDDPKSSSELDAKMTRARAEVMYASILVRKGKKEEALEYSSAGLESYKERYGFSHPQTLMSGHNHAIILTTLKRNEEAIKLFQEVLANRESVLGLDHPDTLMTTTILANTFVAEEELEKAIPLYESAISRGDDRYSSRNPIGVLAASRLAKIRLANKSFDEAKRLHQKLAQYTAARFGDEHWRVAARRGGLAEVHLLAGEPELAIEIAKESYETISSALGVENRYSSTTAKTLSMAYKAIDDSKAAAEWLEKANKKPKEAK